MTPVDRILASIDRNLVDIAQRSRERLATLERLVASGLSRDELCTALVDARQAINADYTELQSRLVLALYPAPPEQVALMEDTYAAEHSPNAGA